MQLFSVCEDSCDWSRTSPGFVRVTAASLTSASRKHHAQRQKTQTICFPTLSRTPSNARRLRTLGSRRCKSRLCSSATKMLMRIRTCCPGDGLRARGLGGGGHTFCRCPDENWVAQRSSSSDVSTDEWETLCGLTMRLQSFRRWIHEK